MNQETAEEISKDCGDDPTKWAKAYMDDDGSFNEFEIIGWFTAVINETRRLQVKDELLFDTIVASVDPKEIRNPTRPSDLDNFRDWLMSGYPCSFKSVEFENRRYIVTFECSESYFNILISSPKLKRSWRGDPVFYRRLVKCQSCGQQIN